MLGSLNSERKDREGDFGRADDVENPMDYFSGPKEECGIVGIASDKPVARDLYYSLRVLQHRGQESAGIAVFNNAIHCIKDMGLVHEVFDNNTIMSLGGNTGIGHVRYSTTGHSRIENAQPVVARTAIGDIALAHNGDIVNADEIRDELQDKGWAFITTTDSEILIRLLANNIRDSGDMVKAIKEMMGQITGSYSIVILWNDTIFGVRDPLAIKPLCIGKKKDAYIVVSESVALDLLGGERVRDVEPGEIVELKYNELKAFSTNAPRYHAHCMFEWVYFARPDSIIDGKLVYDVRKELGQRLAKEHPVEADAIVPIPDSGRAHALGYSEASGIPYTEGLIKNRYVERTFIMPEQNDREVGVLLKLNPLRSVLGGKRVILVDDSIIRGTTMKKIVNIVREAGAKEVHLRICCPPVISPCYLGIDMKSRDQFVALDKSFDEIAGILGADSVGYISLDGLIVAIGHEKNDLCLGCLAGEYPVQIPGERLRFQSRLESFGDDEGG